jgi:hypothetical protein
MKKATTLPMIAGLMFISFASLAQEITNYETVYYTDPQEVEIPENTGVKVEIKNVVAVKESAKLAMKITNDSKDIIIFEPSESTFKYEFGDVHPKEKEIIIAPGKSKSKTINVSGGDKFRQEAFSIETSGMSLVEVEGNTVQAENFQLPASRNNMNAGNFEIVLKSYKASTAEAHAIFEVTYTGDKIGLVNSSNLSVRAKKNKSEEEVTYANDYKDSDIELLRKGEKTKFHAVFHIEGRIVDMQFATMNIEWNDTFVESEATPMDTATVPVTWDAVLTNSKK